MFEKYSEERQIIINLGATAKYEEQIEMLNSLQMILEKETKENVTEDLAWLYYWKAWAIYKLNRNNLVCKFRTIEVALRKSIEYKGTINGEFKAKNSWLLANLYKKVCINEKRGIIEKLYLDAARYFKSVHDSIYSLEDLKYYADIYNNLASLTNRVDYLKESLDTYKILLTKKYIDEKYMQITYEVAYDIYLFNELETYANYYLNKITDIEILHNIKTKYDEKTNDIMA